MNDNIIFQITLDDLQNEAMERLDRKLSDEEIDIAKTPMWNYLTVLKKQDWNFALNLTNILQNLINDYYNHHKRSFQ